ncbi:MAG: GTP cyclohydrolase I FolE [Caldilineaceae bacterium]|nr:GTP cyclohydrolase I FolE [Caldilineaceae bacterium]
MKMSTLTNGNGNHNGYSSETALNGYADAHASIFGASHNGTPVFVQEPEKESYDPAFEALVEQMLVRVGEDPQREGLVRTPLRVAKAMDFLTNGYETSLDEVVNNALFEDDGEEMVIVKDIEFYSLCEHHMLPFYGKIHIGYLPNGKIIGLSKLARIADVFARRLQVQERLTNQVADALVEILEPRGVAVIAEASHFCMMMRGVQKQGSSTVTRAMRGDFKANDGMRNEFMQLVAGA